jgi:hypothetical protein
MPTAPALAEDDVLGDEELLPLLLHAASTDADSARMLAAARVFTVVRFIA